MPHKHHTQGMTHHSQRERWVLTLLLMWNCCTTQKSVDWSKSRCQQISQNNCFTYHTNDCMKFGGNTLGKYMSPDYLQHCHQIIFIDIKRIRGIPRCPVEDWQDNLVAVHWLCTIGKVPICWLCILITWLAIIWVILCGNDHLQKKKIDSLVDDVGHHMNTQSQSHHHHHSRLDLSVQVAHLRSYCVVPCWRWFVVTVITCHDSDVGTDYYSFSLYFPSHPCSLSISPFVLNTDLPLFTHTR